MLSALYPGSFDPLTNGHLDLIRRSAEILGRVVVAVGVNPHKPGWLSAEERVGLLKAVLEEERIEGVEVATFSGLVTVLAKEIGAGVIVKGIRAEGDWAPEYKQAWVNRRISGLETLLLPASPEWSALSSSAIREMVSFGASIEGLVPAAVAHRIAELQPRNYAIRRKLGDSPIQSA